MKLELELFSYWRFPRLGKLKAALQPPDRAALEVKRAILGKLRAKLDAFGPLEEDAAGFRD